MQRRNGAGVAGADTSPQPCNLSRFCCWETMTQMTRNATDLPFHYPPELELDAPPIEHAHPTDAVRARKRMSGRIIALAAALWLCMLPLRAIVMGYIDPVSYPTPKLRDLPELLLIGVYDFGYVLAITLVALLAMRLLGRWRILRWSVFGGFL